MHSKKNREKTFNSVKEAKRNCHFMCAAGYLVKLIKYCVTMEFASDLCLKGVDFNLVQSTDYPEICCGFPQSFQANAEIV